MNSRAGFESRPLPDSEAKPGRTEARPSRADERVRGRAGPTHGFGVPACSKIAGLARQTRPDAIFPGGRRTRSGVSLRPFSGKRGRSSSRCAKPTILLHLDKRNPCRRRTRINFHDNVSLVNRAENGSQIARSGKTPDEIPRDAEQDKRTGSAPHPSPVVLSECGKSKDSDSDGRNSQRKH